MAEENTEQTAKELRAERNGKLTKGFPVLGMKKMKVSELSQEFIELDPDVFIVYISEGEHCRTEADIKAVMKESGEVGTILPMRAMKPVTRSVKEVTRFE